MRTQSYILQLLLFVFITVWFVTPSHKPEIKKIKKIGFLHWQRNIHCLILPQFPIVLRTAIVVFKAFFLEEDIKDFYYHFYFYHFMLFYLSSARNLRLHTNLNQIYFLLIPKWSRISSGWNKNKHISNGLKHRASWGA